jgi:site-specific DNA-adenine methylase
VKKEESEVEIINDINSDLVTLYRVIKLHLDEFIRYLWEEEGDRIADQKLLSFMRFKIGFSAVCHAEIK